MTREEASIIIGNIPINGDGCYSIPEYQQAKAMAIKALEQQPAKRCTWIKYDYLLKDKQVRTIKKAIKELEQKPCEDCISRKDMLAIFRQSNSLSQAWDGFEKLSSVTLKEKSEYEHDHEVVKAYNDGQAYILDKIRAEIDQKQYDFMSDGDYNEGIRFGLMLAYQIIDKYRESEVRNDGAAEHI